MEKSTEIMVNEVIELLDALEKNQENISNEQREAILKAARWVRLDKPLDFVGLPSEQNR
jgi:predicted KAP-like P-loop ATPase